LLRNLSERKRAEEALRKLQMELMHTNRVIAMGQLTASIAHEVKQPIGVAVTNAQAVLHWLDGRHSDVDEVRQTLGRIIENGRRAGDVIERIRTLVK
jgi:C4-dicarboxylate-specific signal transduction histidine kinase